MSCKHCSLTNGNEFILNNKKMEVTIAENHLIIFNNEELTATSIPIKYCPICGDQLDIL